MNALLRGVLGAGLCGQALLANLATASEAELPAIGHASVGWQQDDADGKATALALALPLSPVWYLNVSQSEADNQIASDGDDERVSTRSRRFGISLDQAGWGGSLSWLDYDDETVLATQETQLLLRHRGERVELGLELSAREHEVTVQFPLRTAEERFDSRGIGLHVGVNLANDWRLFGGWQQYRYDDARVLDEAFGSRLLDYPRLYNQLLSQRDQADGALADHNAWLGVDVPLAEHLLSFEHARSELELDGSQFRTNTVILVLNLAEHWGLDLSAGVSTGDDADDIRFAGVTLHLFW